MGYLRLLKLRITQRDHFKKLIPQENARVSAHPTKQRGGPITRV